MKYEAKKIRSIIFLETSNIKWGQIDPKGDRRVKWKQKFLAIAVGNTCFVFLGSFRFKPQEQKTPSTLIIRIDIFQSPDEHEMSQPAVQREDIAFLYPANKSSNCSTAIDDDPEARCVRKAERRVFLSTGPLCCRVVDCICVCMYACALLRVCVCVTVTNGSSFQSISAGAPAPRGWW